MHFPMNNEKILRDLEEIIGKDFVSNKKKDLFIYSMDPGAFLPRAVDYVVIPITVDEVQKVVRISEL